jgi:hypothetical protein
MRLLPELNESTKAKIQKLLTDGKIFSVMNNTKWTELIKEMLASPEMKPAFRLRSILASSDYCTDWDRDWHYHIHPVAEVEWIELRSTSSDWLVSTLRKHSIPFSLEDGVPRVWGYTRPGVQPLWVSLA